MKFHRFAFMIKPNREADLRPHEIRDGDAFARLAPALIDLGYRSGPPIINHPRTPKAQDTSLAELASLTSDDLLVITSRPPLDEKRPSRDIRLVKACYPSENAFEQDALFPALQKYLSFCSRNEIVLHPRQADCLEEGYRNREDLYFYLKPNESKQRHEASYSMAAGSGRYQPFQVDRTTAAYLIHTPPLQMPNGREGPRVLVSFGLSGTVGLVLAHQLCEQKLSPFPGLLRDILRGPSLAMIEITVTRDVPDFYMGLGFSDEWDYKRITTAPYVQQTVGVNGVALKQSI